MSGSEEHNPEVIGGAVTDLTVPGQVSAVDLKAKMARMKEIIALKKEFLKENLHEGIDKDYSVIEGCGPRKVLLKPGAEKLLDWHGYYPTFELVASKEDADTGIFSYVYRCTIKQRGSNVVIADCEGDASTLESKYRFEWKYASQLPPNTPIDTLKQKKVGKDIKYQVLVDNPADKRNTVRKMAQKRALLGATVLATATSDLFATDTEPPDPDDVPGNAATGGASGDTKPKADYGNAISEKQVGRLHAIRKKANISEAQVIAWIKARYGFGKIEDIGWKAYEEICKAMERGRLEMPEPEEEPAGTKPDAASGTPSGSSLDSLIAEIDDLEGQIGGNPGPNRQAKTGSADLSTRSETQLRNYLDWLKGQVK